MQSELDNYLTVNPDQFILVTRDDIYAILTIRRFADEQVVRLNHSLLAIRSEQSVEQGLKELTSLVAAKIKQLQELDI